MPITQNAPGAVRHETPGASYYEALEPLLERVSKPIQYVGGELNSTLKEWDAAPEGETVRWALM